MQAIAQFTFTALTATVLLPATPAFAQAAWGLSRADAGGQVARGGILGTRDKLETPFSITRYTNALIQDRQAKSVGEVLQADSGMRINAPHSFVFGIAVDL